MTDLALLALADGRTFTGRAFGAPGRAVGEVVFNTSMTGYQEILTDPSYRGQIVVMTCPEMGNVGVNPDDFESDRIQVAGFVVRSLSPRVSNWRSEGDLGSWLADHGVVGLEGVDTRALTRHIRAAGAVPGALVSPADQAAEEEAVEAARRTPPMEGRDLVREVTCAAPYGWDEPAWREPAGEEGGPHVVAYDFGIKRNILRRLVSAGCRVTVVPAGTSAADAMALGPDGVFLSNGPGDPAAVDYAVEAVSELLGQTPVFGICLGHQILSLALGATTYKLKFGHRGGNQPVRDEGTGRVEITSQNHGFAVAAESLAALRPGVELTHVNLNDGTCEGLACPDRRAFGVQYHPEASPGPHDAWPHFDRFMLAMGSSA